ncbi:MAG: hypothetical protein ACOCXT_03570 [Candidatus Dojkabacteria bacterium]
MSETTGENNTGTKIGLGWSAALVAGAAGYKGLLVGTVTGIYTGYIENMIRIMHKAKITTLEYWNLQVICRSAGWGLTPPVPDSVQPFCDLTLVKLADWGFTNGVTQALILGSLSCWAVWDYNRKQENNEYPE